MKLEAHNLREMFQSNTWVDATINEEGGEYFVCGTYKGHDFSFPITPEHAARLFVIMSEDAVKKVKARAKLDKLEDKTQRDEDKKDEGKKDTSRLSTNQVTPPAHSKPETKEAPPQAKKVDVYSISSSSTFIPPKKPYDGRIVRERLKGDLKALLDRFTALQPVKGSKRSKEELAEIEIARSYLLGEQTQTILSWIKHFEGIKKANYVSTHN